MEGEAPGNPLYHHYFNSKARNKSGNARIISHKLHSNNKSGADAQSSQYQISRNGSHIARPVSQGADVHAKNTPKPSS